MGDNRQGAVSAWAPTARAPPPFGLTAILKAMEKVEAKAKRSPRISSGLRGRHRIENGQFKVTGTDKSIAAADGGRSPPFRAQPA